MTAVLGRLDSVGEAGEVGPALFFMLSDSLVESFRVRLDALGLELADLRIGGTRSEERRVGKEV